MLDTFHIRAVVAMVLLAAAFAQPATAQEPTDSTYYNNLLEQLWHNCKEVDNCNCQLDLLEKVSTTDALKYTTVVRTIYSNTLDCVSGKLGLVETFAIVDRFRILAHQPGAEALLPWYHYLNGKMLFESNQNDSVLHHLQLSQQLFKETATDMDGLALSAEFLAGTYWRMANEQKSLEYRLLSLDYAKGNKWLLPVMQLNLTVHYMRTEQYALAREVVLEHIASDLQLGRTGGMPYINLMKIDHALNAQLDVLELDYSNGVSGCKEMGDLNCQRYGQLAFAAILIERKMFDRAKQPLAEARKLLDDCKNCDEYEREYHLHNYHIYEAENQPGKALEHLKRYNELNRKLDFMEAKRNLELAQATYEFEEKKKEMLNKQKLEMDVANEKLKAAQLQKVIFIVSSSLLLLLVIVIVRNMRFQKKTMLELASQKNLIEMEHARSEELLLNILPKEVAEELKENGRAQARLFENVTVMFTDFSGFTTVSQHMTADELVNELNTCFSAFDAIITRHGIEKIKTIGDAYMAVSGLPIADPNHAVKMVVAAQEIKQFMADRLTQLGNSTFGIRIGINSGPVVAGIVGTKKFAYDIWGDTVNTAARMEQNSEVNQINISQSTFDLVNAQFACTPRGAIEAKNKGKLNMYFVL